MFAPSWYLITHPSTQPSHPFIGRHIDHHGLFFDAELQVSACSDSVVVMLCATLINTQTYRPQETEVSDW